MKSFNSVTLVGRLTKDPDSKEVLDDTRRTSFMLSVTRPYSNADGKKPADNFQIIAWNKLADICDSYFKKRLFSID